LAFNSSISLNFSSYFIRFLRVSAFLNSARAAFLSTPDLKVSETAPVPLLPVTADPGTF